MKKIIYSLWASATVFGFMGACGGDSSDPATNPATTSPNTTNPAVTGTTGTPAVTGGTTGTVSGTVSGTVTGTTGAPVSDCMLLEYGGVETAMAQVPASTGVYSYGDGATTACITAPMPNNVCLDGLGAPAGENYANYGAGIGIKLAADDETGWDATAAGVVGVKFTLAGVAAASPVRVGITLIGLTDNGFVGLNEAGYTMVGEQTVLFSDMKQPSWVTDATIKATPFDATNIHSLQFQLVTAQTTERPYNFCVAGITWVDAAGNAVDIPWSEGGGEGGAGGEGPDTSTTSGSTSTTTTATSSATSGSTSTTTTATSSATSGSTSTTATSSTTG